MLSSPHNPQPRRRLSHGSLLYEELQNIHWALKRPISPLFSRHGRVSGVDYTPSFCYAVTQLFCYTVTLMNMSDLGSYTLKFEILSLCLIELACFNGTNVKVSTVQTPGTPCRLKPTLRSIWKISNNILTQVWNMFVGLVGRCSKGCSKVTPVSCLCFLCDGQGLYG